MKKHLLLATLLLLPLAFSVVVAFTINNSIRIARIPQESFRAFLLFPELQIMQASTCIAFLASAKRSLMMLAPGALLAFTCACAAHNAMWGLASV